MRAGSGAHTTRNTVRGSRSKRPTCSPRERKWPSRSAKAAKNPTVSSTNEGPATRAMSEVAAAPARVHRREVHDEVAAGMNQRVILSLKKVATRSGASRKSRALPVGGVSSTTRSKRPVRNNSCTRSTAMYSKVPDRLREMCW